MCIYCGTNKYRKIYEQHVGPIPKDEQGRSYDVHHIDGNRNNNSPDNLIAVSIEDHLKIHQSQCDWGAVMALKNRLSQCPELRSASTTAANLQRVANGTHPFVGASNPSYARVQNGTHHFLDGSISRKTTQQRLQAGTHNFLGPENNKRMIESGIHPFTKPGFSKQVQEKRLRDGTHHLLTHRVCPHCGKEGKGPTMLRFHFDRCKSKPGDAV